MRRLWQLIRSDRIRRFVEVWRTEGRLAAVRAARRHVRMGLAGQAQTVQQAHATAATELTEDTGCALTAVWTELARKNAFHVASAPSVHRKRRSVAMIGDLNLPQCRKYRVEQLDEIWGALGVDYSYAHYEDIPRALDLLQTATHLMLYRLGSSRLTEMYLYEARRLKLPVIYDIDDPLFSFSAYETYSNGGAIDPRVRRALVDQSPGYLSVMQQADLITLSTPGLVDAARLMTQRPVYLRRNFADRATLETGRTHSQHPNSRRGFKVAFASGSLGHEVDFLSVADDITQFLKDRPDRQFVILGRFDAEKLPLELSAQTTVEPFRSYEAYLAALARVDCAVLPLVDDAFNRCKSAVRVIDAASVAVPSIVGQTGDAGAMIKDGKTGLIAEQGGWLAALEALAQAPEDCAKMGVAARFDLENRWTAGTTMPIVERELIDEIIS